MMDLTQYNSTEQIFSPVTAEEKIELAEVLKEQKHIVENIHT